MLCRDRPDVVVGMAIIAGVAWVMVRIERSHRQLIERKREAWRAGGSVGPEPGRGGCSAGGVGGFSSGEALAPRRLKVERLSVTEFPTPSQ